jgi:hypothetical protein
MSREKQEGENLLSSAGGGVYDVDGGGRLVYSNKSTLPFGYFLRTFPSFRKPELYKDLQRETMTHIHLSPNNNFDIR